jgi:hypothetical protein
VDILRRLFDLEPENESLRFDTSSALLEAADSAAKSNDMKTAERRYMEAVNALVKSPAANERDLNEIRGLLVTGYLGLANAIASQTAGTAHGERRFRCDQARSFQKLAAPILAVASQDARWQKDLVPRSEQATAAMAACGPAPAS